ncbi:MAG: hypothetical protein V4574_09990 [Pseudomonadota bacterium]
MTPQPWFIRTGSGLTTSIRPGAPQGWLLSLAYAATVALLANLASHAQASWLPWAVMIAALTAVYLVAIWRLSEHRTREENAMFMAFHANRRHLPWLLAIAGAGLTIGLAVALS